MIVGVEVFRPNSWTGTSTIAVTTTATASVVFASATPNASRQVRLVNAGSNLAFVAFGSTTATAATTTQGMPIMAGAEVIVSCGENDLALSAITGTGTTSIYFTPGVGV